MEMTATRQIVVVFGLIRR
jgi:hypothetical protein